MDIASRIETLEAQIDELRGGHADEDTGASPYFRDPCGLLRHRATGRTVAQQELETGDAGDYDERRRARRRRDTDKAEAAARARKAGLPDGHWRDPFGLVRVGSAGVRADRLERERIELEAVESQRAERHRADLAGAGWDSLGGNERRAESAEGGGDV